MDKTEQLIEIMRKSRPAKKIKSFTCFSVAQCELDAVEKEVNNFTSSHDVLDIKINIANNVTFNDCTYDAVVIYTVIYEERNE